MIDKETVERIKDAAGIVDVVSDYVQLTRRGANYMGLCPFHNERTPSFSVNPRRNFCYCFSCHKGGSPVNFIMEKEGISYHDALLQLAAKYGIEVNERELNDEERERQNARESMFTANKWAMEYFERNMTDTDEGRDVGLQYFYQRGLTDEAIRAFHLGYATDRGDAFLTAARNAGYSVDTLQTLGLLGRSQQGDRLYDRFRGRVIFPVFTTSGKIVAFGGRTLKGDKAKYINSPESPIYRKSNELYGIYQAKNAISRQNKCFLVEGYMDVIGMWQSGMQNVVASSGTALTEGQIASIHRFTPNVTLIYDGDNAGIHAALRGIDMLLAHRMEVKVLLLPDGHDPDSFARTHTPEEFRQYVEAHETDIIRFKTEVLLRESGDDPQRRTAAIRSIVESLACIPDNIARNVYIGECARQLNVPENVVAMETRRMREKAVREAGRARVYNQTLTEDRSAVPPAGNAPQDTIPSQAASVTRNRPDRATIRLRQCEQQVLKYCVRYGMLRFGDGMDDNGNQTELSICGFVESELNADDITFSVEDYAEAFNEIKALQEPFRTALTEFDTSLETGYSSELKQRLSAIGNDSMSIEDLQAQERLIRLEIDERRNRELLDFAMTWPANHLASHENDTVRRIATELLSQPYQLSKVYSRHGQHVADEYERLDELVPRAIDEWKEAVLLLRIQTIRHELAEAAGSNDIEKMTSLQSRLNEMLQLRSEVAKLIGDRIISAT